MGVKGLWQLLQPTGHPVTLESLEGKVLGIDVSLWLHQAVKGMRDQEGGALDHAHLLSLFHRVSKLLFYRIKPVFVFDGGVPLLKRQTLSLRRQRKEEAESSSEKATRKIVSNQLKQHALNAALGVATSNTTPALSRQPDLFELPPLPETEREDPQPEEPSFHDFSVYDELQCIEDVDLESSDFLSLPAEIQHELLTELKESRRRTCWARLDSLPQASVEFSNYQIAKLMKQNKLTQKIENVRRDMNARTSGDIALSLAGNVSASQIESHKVMSEDGAHYILVKGLSKVTNPAKTVGDMPGDVMPLCDRLTTVTQDRQVLYVNSDDMMHHDGRHGDGYDMPLGVIDRKLVENVDLVIGDGGDGIGANEIILHDGPKTGNDTLKQRDDGSKEREEIDVSHMVDKTTTVESHDTVTEVHDTSDTKSPSGVDSVVDRTKVQEVELLNEVQSGASPRGSTECVWQREVKDDSSVSMAHSVSAESSSLHETITEGRTCQDGQKEEEHKMQRYTDRETEEGKNEDSESDEDFIEVAPVLIDHTVQSPALTTSGEPCDSDVASSSHSPTDQRPLFTGDQPDSPAENRGNVFEGLSQSELEDLQGALQADTARLEQDRGQKQRSATTVTGQMYTEAQELLQLFGVPYMTSPLEAEAQCAYLDVTRQTEGSITDDSDIWLFGGQRVYRNFFNQTRDVEFYKMDDITTHLMLDRAQCISLALLCGSDYTEGVAGVGPVTAMEILAEFPGGGVECLERFRDWWQEMQTTHKVPYKTKIKGQLRKLQLQPGFPSRVVNEAYLTPVVDESREAFQWSLPDLDQLREFTKTRFGWTRQKVDETLLPIMKRLSQTQCQRSIMTYFPAQMTQAKRLKSKRVKAVLNRMRTPDVTSPQNDTNPQVAAVKAKRRRKNVSRGQGTAAVSGGFLSDRKSEAPAEVLLSESSSGSDNDSETGGTTTRTVSTLKSVSEAPSASAGRGKNTRRRQKKASS